jgi:serine/threonine-protein kinase
VAEPKKQLATELLPTMDSGQLARTLEMTPVRLAALEDTVAQNPGSTIEPASAHVDSIGRRAVEGLGESRAQKIAEGLALGKTLGEGGMGVVRLATQRSLGRQVAVKTLKPEAKSDRATLRLLREAWVTGALEHPNIVPVYDLGLDDDGAPIIVLKLIEGKPWSEVATEPAAPGEDLLEKNLRIFVQVCNAVALAHSRGVIHRDLKHENDMIGRFGEVYLVDWGIAVSLRPDPSGRLPLASEATEMAGTPAYMAPEMLGNAPLTERTDVYLLGAILHELLVGKPPHAGENLRAILASIVVSKINLPATVPRDLIAIVERACAREPKERYASAEELKSKVEWYLRHRGSLALSDAALLRASEMYRVLQEGGDAHVVRDRVHHLFAEIRFGFRQALLASSDNDVARMGLRQATRLVVEFELTSGTPEAAASARAELEEPPPDLAAQVAAALKARDVERKRVADLEKMSAQLDFTVGQRTRMAAGLIIGGSWVVSPEIAGWYLGNHPDTTYRAYYVFTVGQTLLAFAVERWGRESLSKSMINRRTSAVVMVMFAMVLTLELSGQLLQMPPSTLLPLHMFVWFTCTALYTILLDRRFWIATLLFLPSFTWACIHPAHVFHMMFVGALGVFFTVAFAWMRPREDATYFVQQVRARHDQLHERIKGRPSRFPKA